MPGMMRFLWKFFPWIILILMVLFLYITNHWPFGKKGDYPAEVIHTQTIVREIEALGRMELVRYNFREILDYKHLSSGKLEGSILLQSYDLEPDITAVMIAAGEAAGCIDFAQIREEDITRYEDSVVIRLPAPELCYHKLDLENTRIHSFTRKGWWSRLFPDDEEEKKVFEQAYKTAEEQIRISALESGILEKTRENAILVLQPMFETITGEKVSFVFTPHEEWLLVE
jgi:hypothetical protein